jgi:hypothetical protein
MQEAISVKAGLGRARAITRRQGVIALFTLVLLGIGGVASSGTAQANDTRAEASGPILNGAVYQDTTGTENDIDWWVFYTGASTQLDIALAGLGPDDCFGPYMNLTDSDGEIIDQSYNVNRNETEHILYTVGTGTFYVEVRPNNVAPCAGSEAVYRLGIGSSPALLSAPPYIPPPAPPAVTSPSTGYPSRGGSKRRTRGCQQAQRRVRTLTRKLRQANRRRARPAAARLRANLRRARSQVRTRC